MTSGSPLGPDPRCPFCGGAGEVLLPPRYPDEDADLYPCPLCQPWPQGFGGFKVGDDWVIAPYASGSEPVWNGYPRRRVGVGINGSVRIPVVISPPLRSLFEAMVADYDSKAGSALAPTLGLAFESLIRAPLPQAMAWLHLDSLHLDEMTSALLLEAQRLTALVAAYGATARLDDLLAAPAVPTRPLVDVSKALEAFFRAEITDYEGAELPSTLGHGDPEEFAPTLASAYDSLVQAPLDVILSRMGLDGREARGVKGNLDTSWPAV